MAESKEETYSPGEMKFTKVQVRWFLRHLRELCESLRWPADADDNIDLPGKKSGSRAPFQTPMEYAAEISTRLEFCGLDGLILLAMVSWGETPEAMSKYLHKPEWG